MSAKTAIQNGQHMYTTLCLSLQLPTEVQNVCGTTENNQENTATEIVSSSDSYPDM